MRDHRFPDCEHAHETDNPGIVRCDKGLRGGRPHVGVCSKCHGRPELVVSGRAPGPLCSHAEPAGTYTAGGCGCKRRKKHCEKHDITLAQPDWQARCTRPGQCKCKHRNTDNDTQRSRRVG